MAGFESESVVTSLILTVACVTTLRQDVLDSAAFR